MALIPRMADSTRPRLIPEVFRQRPNGVLAYADGDYAWPDREVDAWPRHVSIATRPLDIDPEAWRARELDVERGDALASDVPPFWEKRKRELGGAAQVIAYCDRSTVGAVQESMRMQLGPLQAADLLWHIATLDGVKWTPAQIVAHLQAVYGVTILASRVWAVQWLPMGTYDESAVYGDPEWSTT